MGLLLPSIVLIRLSRVSEVVNGGIGKETGRNQATLSIVTPCKLTVTPAQVPALHPLDQVPGATGLDP